MDVVVEELVAEAREADVVEAGEVVVRHLVGRQEIVDLAIRGGGIEGLAGLGEFPLGHVHGNPLADLTASRVGFILIAGERIGTVVVHADFKFHIACGNAVEVVGVSPHIELGVHPFEEGGIHAGDIVEPAEGIPSGVVGKTLGLEHGRAGFILVAAGLGHPGRQFFHGAAGGEAGFDFIVVAEAAIVVETRVEPGEIDVPGLLDLVGTGPSAIPIVGGCDFPRLHTATLLGEDLLGGFAPVCPGHERRIAVKFQGKAGRLHIDLGAWNSRHSPIQHRGHRRLDPFQEIWRAIAHLGKDPRSVLDVGDRRIAAELVYKILRG